MEWNGAYRQHVQYLPVAYRQQSILRSCIFEAHIERRVSVAGFVFMGGWMGVKIVAFVGM